MRNILTLAAAPDGHLTRAALASLGVARRLQAEIGGRVAAVLVGSDVGALSGDLIAHGADLVYAASDPALQSYQAERYLHAIESAVRKAEAGLFIAVADDLGRDLAPRLAYRLGSGMVSDVTGFAVTAGEPRWIRPVFGGKANAVYTVVSRPQIITLRDKLFPPAARAEGHSGEVVNLGVRLDGVTAATRIVEKLQDVTAGKSIEEARILVAGGRGVDGPAGFDELRKLADLLGGAVAASRAAVDRGWVPPSLQVGQTGKLVAPDLYIAIGISGATQHVAGIAGARTVVAINNDPAAEIFNRADLGIVADWRAVFPHLLEHCRALVQR